MLSVNILNVPTQEFSFNAKLIDDSYGAIDMKIRTLVDNSLCCDISVNGDYKVTSEAINTLSPLLPMNTIKGNLYFIDRNGLENPNYEQFNTRFFLMYDEDYKYEVGY